MTNELKNRAKRLRVAIKKTLGVHITLAQSLELVAKEENYPNWDAATGVLRKRVRLQGNTSVRPPSKPDVVYVQGLSRAMLVSFHDRRTMPLRLQAADRIVLIGGDAETKASLQEFGIPAEIVPVGSISPEGAASITFKPKASPAA